MNAPSGRHRQVWYWLLLLPFIGTLFPSWYASDGPELWGFPFFYWYQIVWVFLSSFITFFVYRMTRKRE
ncbi:DUF3311 domain-containing protein [Alicyclobacillus kakegawensis]|uniref:DUF3311 domain-containing protein n=1 Tax=Alicyclobacillus kakegawensis TaxID=392012 RepID=UPI0008322856|nr:DUF3311 domain-containing protein [Alicyclobacillus kakegawensis]